MARPPRDPSLLSWPWGSAPSGSGGPSSAVGLTTLPIVNSHAESAAMLGGTVHCVRIAGPVSLRAITRFVSRTSGPPRRVGSRIVTSASAAVEVVPDAPSLTAVLESPVVYLAPMLKQTNANSGSRLICKSKPSAAVPGLLKYLIKTSQILAHPSFQLQLSRRIRDLTRAVLPFKAFFSNSFFSASPMFGKRCSCN